METYHSFHSSKLDKSMTQLTCLEGQTILKLLLACEANARKLSMDVRSKKVATRSRRIRHCM